MKINFRFILLILFFSLFAVLPSSIQAAKKSYVVYLGSHSHESHPSKLNTEEIADSYYEFLGSLMGSKDKAKEAIFYSYTYDIKGFAAILEDEVAQEISKHPDVVSVFPNEEHQLRTTRTWEFLGLEKNGQVLPDSLWSGAKFGENLIIGVIDSGVWPKSQSFDDSGMGPIPKKWRGSCDTKDGMKCNKKLIGVQYFNKGFEALVGHPLNLSYQTAQDMTGHGTHCLSVAGGGFVPHANLLGLANGTAKGGLPNARVAAYKVSWPNITDADLINAFDTAIHDGVDVISVSLGREKGISYLRDGNAVGGFHATRKGIPVFCSAGNSGPNASTVENVAPWITTVAAGTIDRTFTSNAVLGNGMILQGTSFKTENSNKPHPLIYALDAKAPDATSDHAKYCHNKSLSASKVSGKIVYCESDDTADLIKSWVVAEAGGVGMILPTKFNHLPLTHFVPTAAISESDGPSVLAYIKSTGSPVARISGGTEVGKVDAPCVAKFSSTGPNPITPEILKPDITAPGVNILGANTGKVPLTLVPGDNRYVPFVIASGTSMACPHVAAVGGLLKILNPDWSPAAIRSAIMTTANTNNGRGRPMLTEFQTKATPFHYGSGHIMPNAAGDPGLVYDLTPNDYLNFLCSINYNETQIQKFDSSFTCPSKKTSLLDFNYPSISVPNLSNQVTLTRTLKNVGTPGTYTVSVDYPREISITVNPKSLTFNQLNEEKSFTITVKASGYFDDYIFGSITWTDGVHFVRSPVAVKKASSMTRTDGLNMVTGAINVQKALN